MSGNMIWQSDGYPPSITYHCPLVGSGDGTVARRTTGVVGLREASGIDAFLCSAASAGVENGGGGRSLTATLSQQVKGMPTGRVDVKRKW